MDAPGRRGGDREAGCETDRVEPDARRPPAALTLAVIVVAVESTAQAVFVMARDDFGVGAKLVLVAVVASKVLFAAMARRLRAGGALGLLAFELVGVLVALRVDWAMTARLALVASVVAVYVLVLSSLHAFPTPELP